MVCLTTQSGNGRNRLQVRILHPAPRKDSMKPVYQQIRDKAGIAEYRLYPRQCGKDFMFLGKSRRGATVAQVFCKHWVGGSNPSGGTSERKWNGRIL